MAYYQYQEANFGVDPGVKFLDDSTYESSDYYSPYQSLESSISAYVFENGRRYHTYYGPDKNLHPNDETEQERLDMHHEAFLLMMHGRLHDAPLDKPRRILDIGTGTGIWAIDIADEYPMAEVIGMDLSPIQPQWVPPNCRFEVDDVELDWMYQPDYFDFIHARNISQGISDWPKLMRQVRTHIAPGGYIEIAEAACTVLSDDNTLGTNNPFKIVCDYLIEGQEKIGRPWPTKEFLRAELEKAGFVDIKVNTYQQPYGLWPKDPDLKKAGAMVMVMTETGIEAYGIALFTRVLGMDLQKATAICKAGVEAVKNKNTHMYTEFYVAYGRKPVIEDPEPEPEMAEAE